MYTKSTVIFFSSWDVIIKKIDCRLIEHSNLGNFSVFLFSFFIVILKFCLIYTSLNKLSISLIFSGYLSISSLSLFSFLKIWKVNMSHFIWLHPSAFPLTSLFQVIFHYFLHVVHWILSFSKSEIKVHFYNTSYQRSLHFYTPS